MRTGAKNREIAAETGYAQMSEFHADSVVKRTGAFTATRVEDELVLMDDRRRTYYKLNPVAVEIWNRLDGPVSVASLVSSIESIFNLDHQDCFTDVSAFLTSLLKLGLLEVVCE